MAIRKPICVVPLNLISTVGGNARSNRSVTHLAEHAMIGMRWQSEGNANLWVRGQFDGSQSVDFCSLLAANAQAGTTIRVRLGTSRAEVDGTAPYDSGALTLIDPARTREDGLYHSHLELDTPENASWWRIDIGNHTGDFSAASLIFGLKREPARFYNRDREIGTEDLGEVEFSRNGIASDTPGHVLRTLLFRLQWVSTQEYFEKWEPLAKRDPDGTRKLMLWCFDPEPGPLRQDQTFLGYFGRDPFMRGNTFPKDNEQDFQLRSII